MALLFDNMDYLLKDGIITWGYVIQANEILFRQGSGDAPGEVVYSLRNQERSVVPHLETVARKLGAL